MSKQANAQPVEQVGPQLPAPGRVGQATVVEQTRAAAEVAAAVQVAQQNPRSLQAAMSEMQQSCTQTLLAQRAFYRYSRGGSAVSGASVHLARELARCWGNVQYGIGEMRRDDVVAESEMLAFAWDVQTNTRASNTFIVPHKRDTRDGAKVLTDMRDIYENNANQGARRLREAIFSILPPWFVEQAKELCNQTLENGGGVPLPKRIADAIGAFAPLGIVVEQLEDKLGRPSDKWTAHDVAQLGVVFSSIKRGEISKDEEFPPQRVTAAEIKGDKPAAQPVDPDAEAAAQAAEESGGWPHTPKPGEG